MPRLKWLVILVGLLVGAMAADLAPRAGAAGPEYAPRAAHPACVCPALGIDGLMGENGLQAVPAPGNLAPAETPLRYDCGVGEAWRHHVP